MMYYMMWYDMFKRRGSIITGDTRTNFIEQKYVYQIFCWNLQIY